MLPLQPRIARWIRGVLICSSRAVVFHTENVLATYWYGFHSEAPTCVLLLEQLSHRQRHPVTTAWHVVRGARDLARNGTMLKILPSTSACGARIAPPPRARPPMPAIIPASQPSAAGAIYDILVFEYDIHVPVGSTAAAQAADGPFKLYCYLIYYSCSLVLSTQRLHC